MRGGLEVAQIMRQYGDAYRQSRGVPLYHLKVMSAVTSCRTARLGGHREQCEACAYVRISYNSCPQPALAEVSVDGQREMAGRRAAQSYCQFRIFIWSLLCRIYSIPLHFVMIDYCIIYYLSPSGKQSRSFAKRQDI